MDLQLELLPYHYYNTLGFDEELIDYIDHVDDSIVLQKIAPLYKNGGRPPVDPRTCFRMHYLYFTRPEISSFRELVRQLKEPKNQAWRNFIGVPSIERVPLHSSLSHFRTKVSAELFYAILFDLIAQALKLKDFLQPMLTGIDSRPVWANVNGYKHKRCVSALIEVGVTARRRIPIQMPPVVCSGRRRIRISSSSGIASIRLSAQARKDPSSYSQLFCQTIQRTSKSCCR